MTRAGRTSAAFGDQPAVHPAVAPLVEGQVADLLDGRGRDLVHRRVQYLFRGFTHAMLF